MSRLRLQGPGVSPGLHAVLAHEGTSATNLGEDES